MRVRANIVHLLENIEITKRAVEVGLGVALVPKTAVAGEVKAGQLRPLDLAEGPFDRPIGVVTRKGEALSAPAQKFVHTLLTASSGTRTTPRTRR